MGNKIKSFGSAAALASAVLFFGLPAPTARAQAFRHDASWQGQSPRHHGRIHADARRGGFSRHRSFRRSYSPYPIYPFQHYRRARPFYGGAYYSNPRPYRLVRVFTYAPFPHWTFRRVCY